MKSLVLASALGTVAGAFAVPMLSGPVYFAMTKPHSMFGWVPAGPGVVSVTLGTTPMTFVLTDVAYGGLADSLVVKANGNPVLCLAKPASSYVDGRLQLTTGILIPPGASIVVEVGTQSSPQSPITIAGYLQ